MTPTQAADEGAKRRPRLRYRTDDGDCGVGTVSSPMSCLILLMGYRKNPRGRDYLAKFDRKDDLRSKLFAKLFVGVIDAHARLCDRCSQYRTSIVTKIRIHESSHH
jgi:hypothetical protein